MVTPRRSFKTLFCSNDGGAFLKSAAMTGSLHTSGLRSLAWAWFLSATEREELQEGDKEREREKEREKEKEKEIDNNLSVLLSLVKGNRTAYRDLVQLHITDPRNTAPEADDPTFNNPLSQSEDSPWARFFQNAELSKVIQQDIARCHADKEFFQSPAVQDELSRILFVYAKLNHALSYRQGMHELLAPIVYVLHLERNKEAKDKDPEDAQFALSETEEQTLQALLDKEALEADAFFIFKHLMDITADWFSPVPPPKKNINGTPASPPDEEAATPVVLKCRRIQHLLLKNKDPELHDHLIALKIEPQFYLLRWVRLLLGREFHSLDDLMIIWDAVFAHSPDLVLVDYICVAMLGYIREQLLERDSTGCLTRLMKYPPVEDVRIFIEQAQTLISNRLQKPPVAAQNQPSHPVASPPQTNSPSSHHPERAQQSTSSTSPSSKPKSKQLPPKPKEQPKALQNINPVLTSFKHNLNVDTNSTDVSTLQDQLRTLRDTQLLVAQRIDAIVHSIQQTLTTNALQGNVDALFLSVAELKQTKDILCGFLPAIEAGSPSVEFDDDSELDVDDHPLSDRRQVS